MENNKLNNYMDNKRLFSSRVKELKSIKHFDMEAYKKSLEDYAKNEEMQQAVKELIELINDLVKGISRGQQTHFSKLTIIEKEEVLKNLFMEEEEEI